MKAELILLFPLAGVMLAGPAKRDCGETKSFIGTNDCGVTYGGTWIECATGMSQIPTFTVPLCSAIPSPAAAVNAGAEATISDATPTLTSADLLITPAPTYNPPWATSQGNGTSTCSSLWICVDALAVCGTVTQMYGKCYDTCSEKGELTPPPCTVTAAPSYNRFNRTKPILNLAKAKAQAPQRIDNPLCIEKPFLCAPKDW